MADELIVTVEKLVTGGDGLARIDGKVVFIPFSIPGERLRVRPVAERKDFIRAEIVEILDASPDRQEPPCPFFTRCGGCNFQHMRYARQLTAKQSIVVDAFARTGNLRSGTPSITPSLPLGYRNRVQIHRAPDGSLGFMRRESNSILPIDHCPVAMPGVNDFLKRKPHGEPGRFILFADEKRYVVEGAPEDEPGMRIELCGKSISFRVNGFFQSNLHALSGLITRFLSLVQTAVEERGTAVDLYAGVGLFGSFLADDFLSIVCVEHDPHALRFARMNLAGTTDMGGKARTAKPHLFYPQDVDIWTSGPEAVRDPSLVVADPPRTGLSRPVISYLAASGAQVFIYVSCDPVTLARDAGLLQREGFRLESLELFDFYPQTSHIESLSLFLRA